MSDTPRTDAVHDEVAPQHRPEYCYDAMIAAGAGELHDLSRKAEAGTPSALEQPRAVELTDAVRRIGGSIGGMADNTTSPILDDMRSRLRSIDDKMLFPTGVSGGGSDTARWPA